MNTKFEVSSVFIWTVCMLEYSAEDGVQWMESSVQLYCWHWWHFVAVCIYSIKCFFMTTTMKISLFFQWPWKFFGEHCENCIKSGQKRAFTAWNIPSLHKLGDLMPLPSENTKTKVEASWNGRKHWERLQIFLVSPSKRIKVTMGCIWRKWWKNLLEGAGEIFSKQLPDDILKTLKMSYEALRKEEKAMFLDIGCFLVGEDT